MGALAVSRPTEPDGYTVEMAEGLLPSGVRYELHGGTIHVMVPPAFWHSNVQRRLANFLERQGRTAGTEIGLKIAPRETRVVDVVAFRDEPDPLAAYFPAEALTLVVEVVSPSSVDDDYIDKPTLYARLGIPEFWRVDHRDGAVMIEMFTLDVAHARYTPTRMVSFDELAAEAPGR